MADCAIAVMAKASRPGQAKTRLVPPLTFDEAAHFNTAFLRDVVANIERAAKRRDIVPWLAFGPPGAAPFFDALMPRVARLETWHPCFGDCLFDAVSHLLGEGNRSAIVLNSDSPTLPTALLVAAAERLAAPGDRAVIGPAADGGYYLLGLKAPHRRLFEDIDWSTERVAAQTLARAAEIGLPVDVLPTWYDVDDDDALRMLVSEIEGNASFDPDLVPTFPAHTAALIRALAADASLLERIGSTATISGRFAATA